MPALLRPPAPRWAATVLIVAAAMVDGAVAGPASAAREAAAVPTSDEYTAFPLTLEFPGGPPLWPVCTGVFALCSMANCTTEYPGRDDSDIGEGLAACGCVDNAPGNGLPPYGSLAPLVVLDQGLGDATLAACGNGTAEAVAPECQAVGANAAPFCAALANNTLYGGADLVSLFAESPDGAINTTCTPASGSFGLWANCMSAACVRETAFDGSPVTCFCPIVNTSEPYQVGAPFTTPTDTLCTSHLPGYLLSGKPLTSS